MSTNTSTSTIILTIISLHIATAIKLRTITIFYTELQSYINNSASIATTT